MRAALILAALALGQAAPLAAQNAPAPGPELAAPSEPAIAVASGPIVLISGPETVMAQFGGAPLDPAASLCLQSGEEATLASDRVTFVLVGWGCFTPSVSEDDALWIEARTLENEESDDRIREAQSNALAEAKAAHDAAIASGDDAAIRAAFDRLQAIEHMVAAHSARREALAESERQVLAEMRNARGIGMRFNFGGRSGPIKSRPIIFRLASATPAVLQRFPRGTLVEKTTELCLNDGEQATVSGSHGQSVTYTGPGCLRRKAQPTSTNIGGFTFG